MSYPKVSSASSVVSQSHNQGMKQPPLPPTSIQYVIQGAKGMYIHQNYELNNSVMSMKIKEEPESPTVRGNLPATPKSNEPQQVSEQEGGEQQQQQQQGEDGSKYSESIESKTFVLAPTPAQLGKAPLQRRQNQCKFLNKHKLLKLYVNKFKLVHPASSYEDMTSFIDTLTTTSASINTVPSALPTPTSAEDAQTQMSPSIKGKSYKKLKTDDMDK